MAIEIIGDKTTIVFGYHDVLVGTKAEGDVGYLRLAHFPDGINTNGGQIEMEEEEMFKLKELVLLRFDNSESLGMLIGELQALQKDMFLGDLQSIFEDVVARTEFPTAK